MNLQKPTDIDCFIQYKCTSKKCDYKSWISLKEAKVENFKIVCDCGEVFSPKRIKKLKICYYKETETETETKNIPRVPKKHPNQINGVPVDIMEACVKILDGYSFVRTESIKLVSKAYPLCDDKSTMNVLKKALTLLEINNV